jgi:SAM-dependent methyltransferase
MQFPHGHRLFGNLLAFASLATAIACSPALAADASVPYVPTPQVVVDRMLEIAKVGPKDYLIDLGSGDGRIVVTAAKKYGTRGFGVDLNPTRIAEAIMNSREAGVAGRVQFYQRDLFETDLSDATVITMYLLPRVNLALRPKILDLKPGTRVVSHDFSMGEWKPDRHEEMEAKDKYAGAGGRSDIYLWIVPAKVAGTWTSQVQVRGKPVPYQVALTQEFQLVSGSANVAGRTVKIENAKLQGAQLTFEMTADVEGTPLKHQFTGTVREDSIVGTVDLAGATLQAKTEWSATRSVRAAASRAAGE